MSRRQLRETERGGGTLPQAGLALMIREVTSSGTSVRSGGMEALDEPQHRAKANLRKAVETWVSVPSNVTPEIQSRSRGTGGGGGGTLSVLTQGDLQGSASSGRGGGGNDDPTKPMKKSDHLIVVMKPGNSGGAKGVTG